ncbi:hypothetical protein [Glutamicibacter sp. AOP5-A2-18]|uniref:hypothetical protein n=1 Tax=Glutamicibacter sp. AOP5-A2-18 TaxID=3457656 RepID=UPI0040341986
MGANNKLQATYHGGEYTPSTDSARRAYVFHTAGLKSPPQERAERREHEFDRWLETVRAEAKAEALTEMAKLIESKAKILDPEDPTQRGARIGLITAGCDLNFRANEYKENLS